MSAIVVGGVLLLSNLMADLTSFRVSAEKNGCISVLLYKLVLITSARNVFTKEENKTERLSRLESLQV